MPYAAPKPCAHVQCKRLVEPGRRYCKEHLREVRQVEDERRGSAAQRGYGSKWQKARLDFLREHPLCVQCQAEGRVVAATVVDHIIPHKGDMKKFWSRSNWRPLCKSCHDSATAKYDGGFGHKIRRKE